ncbi:hypothetical protein E1262_27845 [Jiangella aurantiaca]|uniref:Uncharacterized protein n=1 Tax=Jiangella aurantiaca TaxID=2530373 RepID=A0A4R5A1C1_9ACTN|nr:hypothetical protein [Jiangella aurantiaca]TDD64546.1 hypothetical protein E1262_27845 [Jiangella aurantiaca]
MHLSLLPSEARDLAAQLVEIADVAQRAGWTPEMLAQAGERYLPGMSTHRLLAAIETADDGVTDHEDLAVTGEAG